MDIGSRLVAARGWERTWEATATGYSISFGGDDSVLKLSSSYETRFKLLGFHMSGLATCSLRQIETWPRAGKGGLLHSPGHGLIHLFIY
jgi:hypothetical protein